MGRSRPKRLASEGDWSERFLPRRGARRLRDIGEDDDEPTWWERKRDAMERNDQDEIERLEAERDRP